MKTTNLCVLAAAFGLSVCSIAQAETPYDAPARWNNFYPEAYRNAATASGQSNATTTRVAYRTTGGLALPVPPAEPMPLQESATMAGVGEAGAWVDQPNHPMPHSSSADAGCPQCPSEPHHHAVDAGCSDCRPLCPWFGGSNLLFLTLEEGNGNFIASGLGDHYDTSLADPDTTTGFDISLGRYLGAGRYGLGFNYLLWNPEEVDATRFGTAGSIASARSAFRDLSIDIGGAGADTVYNYIDGTGPTAGASGVYFKRNVGFQGIEANLFSFGLMGARRAAFADCCGPSILGGVFGNRFRRGYGYGGASGPMVRGGLGRVRIMTSHGFRWFEVKDFVETGYDIDGTPGFQTEDLYEKVDIENNLFGYQFGARLTYLITPRLNLNIGGKFGLYGNHVEMQHCVGTRTTLAYQNGSPTDMICTQGDRAATDTALATLGELDLGLGYRIGCAWTLRGGYRLLGLTGVANAVDSHPASFASLAYANQVYADDSYVLHGGYFGFEYNW
jgi:hypothetical protein